MSRLRDADGVADFQAELLGGAAGIDGDFKETVRESEPDFYIHVAKKSKANGKL